MKIHESPNFSYWPIGYPDHCNHLQTVEIDLIVPKLRIFHHLWLYAFKTTDAAASVVESVLSVDQYHAR